MDHKFLTVEDVARRLKISAAGVRYLIREAGLTATKFGSGQRVLYLIDPIDLKKFKHRKPGRPKSFAK